MRALRILHVAPYGGDAWAYGGIPRVVKGLTTGLARGGHDVTLLVTDVRDATARALPREATGHRQPHRWSYQSDGVTVHVFPNISNRAAYHLQFFTPCGLGRYMRTHGATFDVAHLHACRNLPGVIAARYLNRAGVPYVLTPNGTAPILERRQLAKRVFDALFGDRVLDAARRVVAVSETEAQQLRALGIPADRVRTVANPIDDREFDVPLASGDFRRTLEQPQAPLVLFLGKITPRKRVADLVEAFSHLPHGSARLVIAGNDMGGGAHLRSVAQGLGVDDLTTFTGLLTGRARLQALADADVVVYPGEHEIFGLVPMEALLAGTPVVVADDSGCSEVVRSVGGGLAVAVGDVGQLAAAIQRVLSDRDQWRGLAVAAARRVRELFGVDRVCEALGSVYAELVQA